MRSQEEIKLEKETERLELNSEKKLEELEEINQKQKEENYPEYLDEVFMKKLQEAEETSMKFQKSVIRYKDFLQKKWGK